MFTTFIVQPLFNLLVLIYALLPGHNFGLALIVFTIVIRLLMWPLVKKQLHHTKTMRAMQPELRRIKKEAKGDRQKETKMVLELYKERAVNPFGFLPTLILQMVILFGLFAGINKIIKDPHEIVKFAYEPLQNLPWMEHVARTIHAFDNSLFGVVDLSRAALGPRGVYIPALLLVLGSAYIQFLTSRQLTPVDADARKLRDIFKAAGQGEQADTAEMNAAMSRNMVYFIPFIVFITTIYFAAALSLYWLVSGIVAYLQQRAALQDDVTEMKQIANASAAVSKNDGSARNITDIREAEIVSPAVAASDTVKNTKRRSSKKHSKKRRR